MSKVLLSKSDCCRRFFGFAASFVAALAFSLLLPGCLKAEPAPLEKLKQSHPRLIMSDANLQKIDMDSAEAKAFDALSAKADAMLAAPDSAWRGDTMLEVSRTVLKRVTTLAYLYKKTGVRKYFERARSEMLAAASFTDWHPAHFLDCAEMMDALALGYDCLYDDLSASDRKKIASAIWQKGLLEAADAYAKKSEFWTRENHTNWNTVCNGSILTAALALSGDCDGANFVEAAPLEDSLIGGTTPQSIFAQALPRFRDSLAHYEPDGAFDEGPTYWHYSTAYAARAISALSTACGGEFDCCRGPGFAHTGQFARAMVGAGVKASGLLFNYADSGEKLHSAPELFWLASRFGDYSLAAFERSLIASDPSNVSAFDLIWWQSGGEPIAAKFSSYGGNSPLVVMHGAGQSDSKFFAGLFGGDNHSHHSHLGLGNFVLDFDGTRFVKLLGPDDYDMPGYFERSKDNDSAGWKYYRNNSQGQNVITFDGKDQNADARASLASSSNGMDVQYAVFNLDHACLRAGVAAMSRGLAHLVKDDTVLIQDEYKLLAENPASSIDWHFHTDADVALVAGSNGHIVKLSKAGKSVFVSLITPAQGIFNVQDIDLAPPQYPTKGLKKISLKSAAAKEGTVAVVFYVKYDPDKSDFSKLIPLTLWPSQLHTLEQN